VKRRVGKPNKRDRGLVSANDRQPRRRQRNQWTQKNPLGLPLSMQEGRRSLRTENGIRRRTCSQQEICGASECRARGLGRSKSCPAEGPSAPVTPVRWKIRGTTVLGGCGLSWKRLFYSELDVVDCCG